MFFCHSSRDETRSVAQVLLHLLPQCWVHRSACHTSLLLVSGKGEVQRIVGHRLAFILQGSAWLTRIALLAFLWSLSVLS